MRQLIETLGNLGHSLAGWADERLAPAPEPAERAVHSDADRRLHRELDAVADEGEWLAFIEDAPQWRHLLDGEFRGRSPRASILGHIVGMIRGGQDPREVARFLERASLVVRTHPAQKEPTP